MNEIKLPVAHEQRMKWVEPELRQLDVRETTHYPLRGGDGGNYVDCTRS